MFREILRKIAPLKALEPCGMRGPDELIDELLDISYKYSVSDAINHIWHEFVPRHIARLDCQFFERMLERMQRAPSAEESGRLTRLIDLVLGALGYACWTATHEIVDMTKRHDLTESAIESNLRSAEPKYHFGIYVNTIFMCLSLYQAWEPLHTPDQEHEGRNLRMIIRVANRLQPCAGKIAAAWRAVADKRGV